MRSQTIDQVIANLSEIIESAKLRRSRLGYFPALYRKVTIAVKNGIELGLFQDGPRMEKLDVIFANRYLHAYDQYHTGGNPTAVWKTAFEAGSRWWPIVLQHLLLGMNAHISLDLGIAAAQTVPRGALPELQYDFNKINEVLSALIDEVQGELTEIWPQLRWFDLAARDFDELLSRFGLEVTRFQAWRVAQEVAALPEEQRPAKIEELDGRVAQMNRVILNPGCIIRLVLAFVRLGELRSVRQIIRILE